MVTNHNKDLKYLIIMIMSLWYNYDSLRLWFFDIIAYKLPHFNVDLTSLDLWNNRECLHVQCHSFWIQGSAGGSFTMGDNSPGMCRGWEKRQIRWRFAQSNLNSARIFSLLFFSLRKPIHSLRPFHNCFFLLVPMQRTTEVVKRETTLCFLSLESRGERVFREIECQYYSRRREF